MRNNDVDKKSIIFEQKAFDTLFELIVSGNLEALHYGELKKQAEFLSLLTGFENLISLDANRIDEFPHQIEAARRALKNMRGRALLADEVGLGKTIEAGIILKELILRGLVRKILILTPASLVTQWKQELETKFFEKFVINRHVNGWEEHNKIIASLDLAKGDKHAAKIHQIDYDLVIIDEAHRLKNRHTKAWQFVNKIKKKYILMLTATPVHNDLMELYNLITLLKPGQLGTTRKFRSDFIATGDAKKPKNQVELKRLLSEVMIRNRRSNTEVKIPPRTVYAYNTELSKSESELYRQLNDFSKSHADSRQDILHFILLQKQFCSSTRALSLSLRSIMNSHPKWKNDIGDLAHMAESIEINTKLSGVKQILKQAQDRVIIFTDFRPTCEYLEQELSQEGYSVCVFHGGLNRRQRDHNIETFAKDGDALICTKAGAEGRNLQFCNIMVNFDLPWNPMLVEQRIGRIHRIGQKREVFVFNLSLKKTIEEYILELLTNKLKMFEIVIGELDLILGNLESDETFEGTLKNIWAESLKDGKFAERLEAFGDKLTESRDRFAEIKETELIVSQIFD
ncbi:DEAD/DEAH box helicase [bacterium]|nr:DEAD/DEAH box helicase [bacterium]